jgi:nitrate/nitrite transport system substrate-binding protein
VTRRDLLKRSAAAALAAGLPLGWRGGVHASDAPEHPRVRLGIIALTDCASIVMAHELGLFKKHGIESTISKEASWAVIRDRLTLGENQATHMLIGMPYAATMGLQGSPVKPMVISMYLNRNGQAITLTKALLEKGVKTPQQLRPLALAAKAKGSPMTFAMTYPPGAAAVAWAGRARARVLGSERPAAVRRRAAERIAAVALQRLGPAPAVPLAQTPPIS